MPKPINILILFALLSLFSVCAPEHSEVAVPQEIKIEKNQKTLITHTNSLVLSTFKKETRNNQSNVLISPIGINTSTAFILFANQEEKKSISPQIPKNELIEEFFNFNELIFNLDKNFNVDNKTILKFNQKPDFSRKFNNFLQEHKYYHTQFSDDKTIQTNRRILNIENNLLAKFSFPSQTDACESPFYLTPGEIKFVQMLKCENSFNYYSNEYLKAIEIPIGQGNFNALFILPESGFSYEHLIKMINPYILNTIENNYRKLPLSVYIPELNIDYFRKGSIKNRYTNFKDSGKLSFQNIEKSGNIRLNNIYFNTKLKTISKINYRKSSTNKNNLFIDRPFILIIKEQYTDAIVFIGQIVNP